MVGFSNYARELRETDLAEVGWDMVQGTNLHHALDDRWTPHRPASRARAGRVDHDRRRRTAHLQRDGRAFFDWPPSPETIELTLAEVDKLTRRHATLSIFMFAEDARPSEFVDNMARRNGGRVLQLHPERLGEYVIRDFLRIRDVSGR